ncbi:MAG: hypothetical protein ISR99_00145 [Parcubacteria group bacterium]|nr:hypothetical protein [Parcubacteria group bacterium]
MEKGPKGADFKHRQLEARCLNPGTDLFDLRNVGNGFYEASIAVMGTGPFAYDLTQKLAFPTVAKTTDGAWVIRVFVFYTKDNYTFRDGPPTVSLSPWKTLKERNNWEKKRRQKEFDTPPKPVISNLYSGGRHGVPRQALPTNLHATGQEGSGLLPSCTEGLLTIHGWDFGTLPNPMQQLVIRAESDGRRHFVSTGSFSTTYGKELRQMADAGSISKTSKQSAVRVSIINPDGTEGESQTFRFSDGMIWVKFSPTELPKGSMVRMMVSNEFMSPSVNPESRRRELRLVSWQGRCSRNVHMVLA